MSLRDSSSLALEGLIERLQLRLDAHATAATREWWMKYLRGAASFRGVKMGDVRKTVHAWFEEERLEEHLSVGQQKDLALMLLEENHTEDKLAGVGLSGAALLGVAGCRGGGEEGRIAVGPCRT
jgi:hypothetical protein